MSALRPHLSSILPRYTDSDHNQTIVALNHIGCRSVEDLHQYAQDLGGNTSDVRVVLESNGLKPIVAARLAHVHCQVTPPTITKGTHERSPKPCPFDIAWRGKCKSNCVPGEAFCPQHLGVQCQVCRKQATCECGSVDVCGGPLCATCKCKHHV